MDDILSKLKKYAHTELIHSLIYGNVSSIREVQEMFNLLDIHKMPNCVMLISIDNFAAITSDLSQMRKKELRLEVFNEIQKAINTLESGLAALVGENKFAVIFNLEFEDKEQIIKDSCEIAKFIKNAVDKATSSSVSIGIGWRYSSIHKLNLSFNEAQSALEHRFFKGGGKIIHIGQAESFHEGVTLFSPAAQEELISKVRLGNKEGAEEILEEIMSGTLSQAYPSPEIVQARYLELIMNLLRAAIESGIPSHKIADYSSEYVKKLFNSDTAHNMSKHMHELVTDLTDSIKASHSGKNLKMIQSAVNFIDENYSKDLCLEEAAQSIGLSSYYFSHLFKRETGQTFIEYLTKIRIEKAKKLLSETNLNVAEVSEKVGYQDPKYFSRVFKNIVGIPPSKFC